MGSTHYFDSCIFNEMVLDYPIAFFNWLLFKYRLIQMLVWYSLKEIYEKPLGTWIIFWSITNICLVGFICSSFSEKSRRIYRTENSLYVKKAEECIVHRIRCTKNSDQSYKHEFQTKFLIILFRKFQLRNCFFFFLMIIQKCHVCWWE